MSGTDSSTFETEEMRPVAAWCDGADVNVRLKDGRTIAAPLWWYPFLSGSSIEQLNAIELMFEGIWWDHVDEGISVKSMFLGRKMPNAVEPRQAA